MEGLLAFQEKQKQDQHATITFSHYITRLFASSHPALVWGRKFGLFSIDLLPAVKTGFARQAMGMGARRSQVG
jgi:2-octaprenyl-6-methoxyphenol hydroxylase